jgi:hypothetical protein
LKRSHDRDRGTSIWIRKHMNSFVTFLRKVQLSYLPLAVRCRLWFSLLSRMQAARVQSVNKCIKPAILRPRLEAARARSVQVHAAVATVENAADPAWQKTYYPKLADCAKAEKDWCALVENIERGKYCPYVWPGSDHNHVACAVVGSLPSNLIGSRTLLNCTYCYLLMCQYQFAYVGVLTYCCVCLSGNQLTGFHLSVRQIKTTACNVKIKKLPVVYIFCGGLIALKHNATSQVGAATSLLQQTLPNNVDMF